MRRLRRTGAAPDGGRDPVGVDDLVAPLFVREGIDEPQPIASLPGRGAAHPRRRWSSEVRSSRRPRASRPSSSSGCPSDKDADGSGAVRPRRHRAGRAAATCATTLGDDVVLMADLCVDEYTDHGHCGVVTRRRRGRQRRHPRAATPQAAVAQAAAGADIVAPSGMMDGQVAAIRDALDDDGFARRARSWPTRPSSPRRSTARSGRRSTSTIAGGGDRKGYQQDHRNAREALEEIRARPDGGRRHRHGEAGAVLPRHHRRAPGPRPTCRSPRTTCPGSTRWSRPPPSGAGSTGPAVALEQLTAIKRAGADLILTYFAREVAEAWR